MASNNNISLIGAKEIQKMFHDLPKQINKDKIWNNFFKKISKPALSKAKSLVPKNSGQLSRSLGYFRTKASKRFLGGYIGPRVKGKFAKINKEYKGKNKKKIYDQSGYYGAWIEYGNEVMFGGKGLGKAQEYMLPAFQQTKNQMINESFKNAEIIMAKAIKTHVNRMNKFGKFGY